MKVLYDEEKAVLEKQQRDLEIPKENRRARLLTAVVLLTTAALVVGSFFGLRALQTHCGYPTELVAAWPWVLFMLVSTWIASVLLEDIALGPKRYSANAEYYIRKGDKKVLDHELEYNSCVKGYMLWLTLEDESHVVSKELLSPYWLTSETRADISETIVDLEKEIVYKPYCPRQ